MGKYSDTQYERTANLISDDKVDILRNSRVAVFGVGGVGGTAVEALARAGVGAIDIIDKDVVSVSNINRQIIALHSTVGKYKVDVCKERILDINPECSVRAYRCFYLEDTRDDFDFSEYSYIIDAVDTVTAKLILAEEAGKKSIPIISSMGTGNKLDPTAFMVADVYNTSVCPLAKVMRRELRKRGIEKLKVVYSEELPADTVTFENNRPVPSSISFVPTVAGFILAGEVIKDLIGCTI